MLEKEKLGSTKCFPISPVMIIYMSLDICSGTPWNNTILRLLLIFCITTAKNSTWCCKVFMRERMSRELVTSIFKVKASRCTGIQICDKGFLLWIRYILQEMKYYIFISSLWWRSKAQRGVPPRNDFGIRRKMRALRLNPRFPLPANAVYGI